MNKQKSGSEYYGGGPSACAKEIADDIDNKFIACVDLAINQMNKEDMINKLTEELKKTKVEEAIDLVNGDRQKDYGHPADDFVRSAGMLSSLGYRLSDHNGNMRELDATDIPIIMMCVKLSREINKHKDDNIVDIIGYAKTLDMVYERRQQKKEDVQKANFGSY